MVPPNRQLSLIIERNIIDVAQFENCTHVNFRLCDVYYVVRSAKQKKDNFFYVEMAKLHFISEKNVLFHISVGRTLKLAKRAKHENMQSRVNFPDFSLSCSYIAKVTPLNYVVVVYALLC